MQQLGSVAKRYVQRTWPVPVDRVLHRQGSTGTSLLGRQSMWFRSLCQWQTLCASRRVWRCRQLLPSRQPLQVGKLYLSGQSKEFRFLRAVGKLYCCRSAECEPDRDRFQVHALISADEPAGLVTGPGGVSSAVPKTPSMYLCETNIRCTMLPVRRAAIYPAMVHKKKTTGRGRYFFGRCIRHTGNLLEHPWRHM